VTGQHLPYSGFPFPVTGLLTLATPITASVQQPNLRHCGRPG
jgi:hypothetical protein